MGFQVDTSLTPEWYLMFIIGFLPCLLWPFVAVFIFVSVAYVSIYAYYYKWGNKYLKAEDKAVVITGCDSGFGYDLALLLDEAGVLVFAGCLDDQGSGANFLRAQGSTRLVVVPLDVTKDNSVAGMVRLVKENLGDRQLWGLYNNAGISGAGEIEWTSVDVYKRIAEVNLYGTIRVTRALLPFIREAKGRIVTVTSGIARIPLPGRSVYTISKAATESYMEVLRYEMIKFGVHTSVICPGNLSGVTKIFASMDAMLKDIYKNLDPNVRQAYGKAYLDAFHTRVFGYRQTGSTLSTKPVTDALTHALFSAHPRYRYRPMTWDWLVWDTLFNVLPEDVKYAYFKWWFLPKLGLPKLPAK